jgi:3-hydroxybutyryl-CoA dehydrogenase
MGRGIAHAIAAAGRPVVILDMKEREAADFSRLAADARREIESNLRFLAELDAIAAEQVGGVLRRIDIRPVRDSAAVLGGADLVIEGVPETMEAKQACLADICRYARADAIITSTTSTLLVSALQASVVRPERFLNTHFLNPAYLLPLVEVSAGPATAESVVDATMGWLESIGKVPVRCAPSPGYIIPRLQALVLAEAARMVQEGVATAEAIDKAVMIGFGPRYATMGFLEFIDWGGADILHHAGNYLATALNSPRHAPPSDVTEMVRDRRGGLRDGRGYYDYRQIDVEAYRRAKLSRFVRLLKVLNEFAQEDALPLSDRG